jgi:nucleoside-diphosphate kinase
MLKAFLAFTAGKILCSNELVIPKSIAEIHYAHVKTRRFYKWLLAYISCYKSFVFILKTDQSIDEIRKRLGNTIVQSAPPESLRYIYGLYDGMNGLHLSESEEAAKKEIENWLSFGVLKPGKLDFDVPSFVEKYLNAPDNSKQIHDLLSIQKERDSLFTKSPKYAHRLFDLIQEEAVDIDSESTRRFYDLILEGISVH